MVVHVAAELVALADLCELEDLGTVHGWTIDRWELDEDALEALRDLYDALLLGDLEEEVADILDAHGVDVDALLRADDATRDTITRSDLTELLAAAAALGADGWPIAMMHLPNVPKGSRRRSEVGIDVLSTSLDFDSTADELHEDERLLIGSVKHTIADPADLRRKLVKSVSIEDLNPAYVAGQLRIYHGRLSERGLDPRRVYLFLIDLHTSQNVCLTITGAVAPEHGADFETEMQNLPDVTGNRHCRHLVIPGLATLHDEV